jgi:hypothetical protein
VWRAGSGSSDGNTRALSQASRSPLLLLGLHERRRLLRTRYVRSVASMTTRARGALSLGRRLRCAAAGVGASAPPPPPLLLACAGAAPPASRARWLAPCGAAGFHAAAAALEARMQHAVLAPPP